MNDSLELRHKIIITIHFVSAVMLILFWGGYYLFSFNEWGRPAFYSGLNNALAMPDSILVLIMLAAGFLMIRKNRLGTWLSILVALIFLILGVVGFRLESSGGLLLISMVTVLKSGFVNLWCIVFRLFFLLKLTERKSRKRGRT